MAIRAVRISPFILALGAGTFSYVGYQVGDILSVPHLARAKREIAGLQRDAEDLRNDRAIAAGELSRIKAARKKEQAERKALEERFPRLTAAVAEALAGAGPA